MAKTKLTLEFEGLKDLIAQLDEMQGDIKKASEDALKASHKIVSDKVTKAMRKDNLPAKGKYSTGHTAKGIIRDDNVSWNGLTASVDVGFDIEKNGLTSIFLMYGTPKIDPVSGLKAAIYGAGTKKEVASKQKEIFENALKKFGG